jgi:hypothetical protein
MFYEVVVDSKIYKSDIGRKCEALKLAEQQWLSRNYKSVDVFRKYPETDRTPSHTEIIYLRIK